MCIKSSLTAYFEMNERSESKKLSRVERVKSLFLHFPQLFLKCTHFFVEQTCQAQVRLSLKSICQYLQRPFEGREKTSNRHKYENRPPLKPQFMYEKTELLSRTYIVHIPFRTRDEQPTRVLTPKRIPSHLGIIRTRQCSELYFRVGLFRKYHPQGQFGPFPGFSVSFDCEQASRN